MMHIASQIEGERCCSEKSIYAKQINDIRCIYFFS